MRAPTLRRCLLFNSAELLPSAWSALAGGPLWAFNPGILKVNETWILAYRIVGHDQTRRIAFCRLDSGFRVVEGSQVAFSDHVHEREKSLRNWFADPRLYRLGSQTYVYWNTGWHEPENKQYLQAFDPETLLPVESARELILDGPRQKLEKNWSLFGDGPFYAIYSITPHRVLQFSLAGEGPIHFQEIASHDWSTAEYSSVNGELRGGAPPQRSGDSYYSVCHSLRQMTEGVRYRPAVYRFSAKPPFEPQSVPLSALKLGNPFGATTAQKRLNPAVAEVLYPCGFAIEEDHCVLSHGINDEHCALSLIPFSDLEQGAKSL